MWLPIGWIFCFATITFLTPHFASTELNLAKSICNHSRLDAFSWGCSPCSHQSSGTSARQSAFSISSNPHLNGAQGLILPTNSLVSPRIPPLTFHNLCMTAVPFLPSTHNALSATCPTLTFPAMHILLIPLTICMFLKLCFNTTKIKSPSRLTYDKVVQSSRAMRRGLRYRCKFLIRCVKFMTTLALSLIQVSVGLTDSPLFLLLCPLYARMISLYLPHLSFSCIGTHSFPFLGTVSYCLSFIFSAFVLILALAHTFASCLLSSLLFLTSATWYHTLAAGSFVMKPLLLPLQAQFLLPPTSPVTHFLSLVGFHLHQPIAQFSNALSYCCGFLQDSASGIFTTLLPSLSSLTPMTNLSTSCSGVLLYFFSSSPMSAAFWALQQLYVTPVVLYIASAWLLVLILMYLHHRSLSLLRTREVAALSCSPLFLIPSSYFPSIHTSTSPKCFLFFFFSALLPMCMISAEDGGSPMSLLLFPGSAQSSLLSSNLNWILTALHLIVILFLHLCSLPQLQQELPNSLTLPSHFLIFLTLTLWLPADYSSIGVLFALCLFPLLIVQATKARHLLLLTHYSTPVFDNPHFHFTIPLSNPHFHFTTRSSPGGESSSNSSTLAPTKSQCRAFRCNRELVLPVTLPSPHAHTPHVKLTPQRRNYRNDEFSINPMYMILFCSPLSISLDCTYRTCKLFFDSTQYLYRVSSPSFGGALGKLLSLPRPPWWTPLLLLILHPPTCFTLTSLLSPLCHHLSHFFVTPPLYFLLKTLHIAIQLAQLFTRFLPCLPVKNAIFSCLSCLHISCYKSVTSLYEHSVHPALALVCAILRLATKGLSLCLTHSTGVSQLIADIHHLSSPLPLITTHLLEHNPGLLAPILTYLISGTGLQTIHLTAIGLLLHLVLISPLCRRLLVLPSLFFSRTITFTQQLHFLLAQHIILFSIKVAQAIVFHLSTLLICILPSLGSSLLPICPLPCPIELARPLTSPYAIFPLCCQLTRSLFSQVTLTPPAFPPMRPSSTTSPTPGSCIHPRCRLDPAWLTPSHETTPSPPPPSTPPSPPNPSPSLPPSTVPWRLGVPSHSASFADSFHNIYPLSIPPPPPLPHIPLPPLFLPLPRYIHPPPETYQHLEWLFPQPILNGNHNDDDDTPPPLADASSDSGDDMHRHPIGVRQSLLINDINGKTISLSVNPHSRISLIKRLIYRRTKVPVKRQTLTFRGTILRDRTTLFHAGVLHSNIIHLSSRLAGGADPGGSAPPPLSPTPRPLSPPTLRAAPSPSLTREEEASSEEQKPCVVMVGADSNMCTREATFDNRHNCLVFFFNDPPSPKILKLLARTYGFHSNPIFVKPDFCDHSEFSVLATNVGNAWLQRIDPGYIMDNLDSLFGPSGVASPAGSASPLSPPPSPLSHLHPHFPKPYGPHLIHQAW